MNKWIPKKDSVFIALSFASFSFLVYVGGLFMVLREMDKVESFYADNESVVSKELRAQALRVIAETNKNEIETIRNFLVKKDDEVSFIEEIEQAGRKTEVLFKIDSIDVKEEENNPFKENMEMKISFEGSWWQAVHFLSELEKMSFGVLIKNFELDSNEPGQWSGSISMVVFREK